jgi:hypothetical protein
VATSHCLRNSADDAELHVSLEASRSFSAARSVLCHQRRVSDHRWRHAQEEHALRKNPEAHRSTGRSSKYRQRINQKMPWSRGPDGLDQRLQGSMGDPQQHGCRGQVAARATDGQSAIGRLTTDPTYSNHTMCMCSSFLPKKCFSASTQTFVWGFGPH